MISLNITLSGKKYDVKRALEEIVSNFTYERMNVEVNITSEDLKRMFGAREYANILGQLKKRN